MTKPPDVNHWKLYGLIEYYANVRMLKVSKEKNLRAGQQSPETGLCSTCIT
jgi:hypothetical protein